MSAMPNHKQNTTSEPPESPVSDTEGLREAVGADLAKQSWVFAGWGRAQKITDLRVATPSELAPNPKPKLGQWRATAICGNDITSSVLYVAAICTLQAGIYAPLALAAVGVVLYLFRSIYAEVGTALPLNGGAYNVLLNTTSKFRASVAACLTLLSYVATAVISSTEALHYAHEVLPTVPVFTGTICLLLFFAILNVIGIRESSTVALAIFVAHLATLSAVVVTSGISLKGDVSILFHNLQVHPEGGFWRAMFFGFAAGMLGISGFESSANFIEEQRPGVFPKTLRNMWVAVFFFNTVVSFLALGLIPMAEFPAHREALLSEMAARSSGSGLATWIGIDAFLVLSGAVLTSYVGVTGLVRRMSLDRCLPQFLLRENRARGTPHYITLSFLLLCVSILVITEGDVETLAGVYTLSFLGVMALFALGNRLLALKRHRLPRAVRASWPGVLVAFGAVAIGLVGNIMRSPQQALIFLAYFGIALAAVTLMFVRMRILQAFLYMGHAIHERVQALNAKVAEWTVNKMNNISDQAMVFFTRGDGPINLRRAIEYVLKNEHTRNLKVVHVYAEEGQIPKDLAHHLKTLDTLYPEIRIDFLAVKGRFSPELVAELSERLGVPRNYMFIGCPGDGFPHNLADLGGVRLIV